jgi:tetratricopeptide (TPR) repeat protein
LLSILAIVLIVVFRKKKQYIDFLFGALWFVLFLIPALFVSKTLFEFRAYCSVIGIAVFIGRAVSSDRESCRNTHYIGPGVIILLFSIVTWNAEDHYRDRMAYANDAFLNAPSADNSYSILGGAYIDQGKDAAAEKVLITGVQRNPSMTIVHRMLGDIYANRGNYSQAAQEYKTSLRIEPLHLYTYINYGKLCLQTGNYDQAVQLWKTSVAINPEFILGYYYLTNFYVHTRTDPDSAMIYAREIQRHGAVVMPELLESIEAIKKGGK